MKKGKKTTTITIVASAFYVATFVMYALNKINTQELTGVMGVITATLTTLIGIFSKDHDQTHTKD